MTFFHAAWLIHLAHASLYETAFNYGMNWINERGDIDSSSLAYPPPVLYEDDHQDWTTGQDMIRVPDISCFTQLLSKQSGSSESAACASDIGLQMLTRDVAEWDSESLVRSLAAHQ